MWIFPPGGAILGEGEPLPDQGEDPPLRPPRLKPGLPYHPAA